MMLKVEPTTGVAEELDAVVVVVVRLTVAVVEPLLDEKRPLDG